MTQRTQFRPQSVEPPKLLKPTARAVMEVVPNELIAKLKPMTPLKPRNPLS